MNQAVQYLNRLRQERRDRTTLHDLSSRSKSGIEYATAILYAEYLGINLSGSMAPWIRRLRKYPLAVPDTLLSGVRDELELLGIQLTDQGELHAT